MVACSSPHRQAALMRNVFVRRLNATVGIPRRTRRPSFKGRPGAEELPAFPEAGCIVY